MDIMEHSNHIRRVASPGLENERSQCSYSVVSVLKQCHCFHIYKAPIPVHWLKGGCSNIRFTFFIQPKRELLEGLNNLPIINQTFLYKNVPLIFGMGPPFRTFWKSWFEEQGGYIMPGNRQSGEFWWGVLLGSSESVQKDSSWRVKQCKIIM